MLEQPVFALTDPHRIDALVREHPWCVLVSAHPDGPVVSHLPVLLDPDAPAGSGTVVGHVARADARLHALGEHDVVVVVQGPHGYLSPSWYGEVPHVPTWDFEVLHLHGRPELLDATGTYAVLDATVAHFERRLPRPWRLDAVDDYAHRIAGGTTGFRLRPSRVVAKAKLSQDESVELRRRVVEELRHEHPYRNPALADAVAGTLAATS